MTNPLNKDLRNAGAFMTGRRLFGIFQMGSFLGFGFGFLGFSGFSQTATNSGPARPPLNSQLATSSSTLIELAGRAEYGRALQPSTVSPQPAANWAAASPGLVLHPGDRFRTLTNSRAAIQLADRSVIRLHENTTLELLPPRRAEAHRFSLLRGLLFFFNREKPGDVEFDTPLAAGAIRGTEFVLQVADGANAVDLMLLDGLVSLDPQITTTNSASAAVNLSSGEQAHIESGRQPQVRPLNVANSATAIQWALYYPAIINPDDLSLSADETQALESVLARYREGDILGALELWPDAQPNLRKPVSPGVVSLKAALDLAVGNVSVAEGELRALPNDFAPGSALFDLIQTVKGSTESALDALISTSKNPAKTQVHKFSPSEYLAHSYRLQRDAQLAAAREGARTAVTLAPRFGLAHARLAELEFSFGARHAALRELDTALALSPKLVSAHALRGFVLLEQGDTVAALASFERARSLDAAFGPAWLGRGLCLMRQRRFEDARQSFQAAAALEPQRSVFRTYLGKAASELGNAKAAEKELRLASKLDPQDPSAWYYAALHLWQQNRLNEAIRDLEKAMDLNDQQAPFRSELLLDADRSARSADLAALYEEAGLTEASRRSATRSVNEDYANFSGHLFLANSYQAEERQNRFDLRLETARQSELLVANLLAPPGAGNLSQQLSQQEHLRFFDYRPFGVSSLTEYESRGDWHQTLTAFGNTDRFSYALDFNYDSENGQRINNDLRREQVIFTAKQRITADDDLYFQVGQLGYKAGDVANYYEPTNANPGLRVHEFQEPTLYAGWTHHWSPEHHTMLLAGRIDDNFQSHDPQADPLFLVQSGGVITSIQSPPAGPPFEEAFHSHSTLYSAELQHIWQTERQSITIGGRFQYGEIDTTAQLSRILTGVVTDQEFNTTMQREDAYGYYSWRPLDPLRLIGGISYSHLRYPVNADTAPIASGEASRDQISPKVGLLFTPWERGQLRAAYTRSLGGLFFDNSIRLEPTQVGGINQAFRSLIPESVAGIVPGTSFDTAGAGFDQSFPHGTWLGVEGDWLMSDGARTVGALTNSLFLPIPDSASGTSQHLNFRERDLSAYVGQLLGDAFAVSAHYKLTEGTLHTTFPEIPNTAAGLSQIEQDNRAVLHQVSLRVNLNHPSGFFAQWESNWYHQSNSGYTPDQPGEDFWQHNFLAGYRFPRRYAELTLGVLNITDRDYHLNPLNPYSELARGRTFIASLRLNF